MSEREQETPIGRLRTLADDLNRGAHPANLAEQIMDECDHLSAEIAQLRAEAATVANERDVLQMRVEAMRVRLGELGDGHTRAEQAESDLAAARQQLEQLTTERDILRAALPEWVRRLQTDLAAARQQIADVRGVLE